MKEQFNDWVPGKPKTKALLQNVQAIIESYSAQDIRLSLRQLYYQLVARALIPNNERSYKRLGDLVTKARYGGLIDWEMIVDHGRVAITPSEWRDPAHIIETGIRSYRLPRWADQDYHLEVWCEKDALTTVLEPITNRYHVSLLAHTGFSSSTALYHAAKRFQEIEEGGRHPVVLYLGDHDPSGLDMFRDIKNRLDILSWSCAIENLRLALTMEQIEHYQPPPNPVKVSDSRAPEYVAAHGLESWELDALEPQVLDDLVSSSIRQYLDADKWDATLKQEEEDKKALAKAAERLERQHKQES